MNVDRLDEDENMFPEITPLVDVILLVLIFFMVTPSFSDIPNEIEMELPRSGVTDDQPSTQQRVFITSSGKIRFQGGWMSLDEFGSTLKEISSQKKKPVLLISADGRARHQRIVSVIAEARESGVQDVGFEIVLTKNDSTSGQ